MYQAGLLATFATDWLGTTTLRRYAMRFKEQAWPGDVLSCEGVVTETTPEPGGGHRVYVDLTCTRQTGSVVSRRPPSSSCDRRVHDAADRKRTVYER
jgi:hypothetical protein